MLSQVDAHNIIGLLCGSGIRPDVVFVDLLGIDLALGFQLVVVVLVLLGRLVAVQAVAVLGVALGRGDQLGQHPREGVDLVAPELGAGCEMRRLLAEHALEPEDEA